MSVAGRDLSWNRNANPYLAKVDLIRSGDQNGYGMVARLAFHGDLDVFAIALPHQFPTRTGPTWVYLLDCEGWTLIDAGPKGALPVLVDGMKLLGMKVNDIERVIISHGHQDHDGNIYDLAEASGATIWAHELYFHFKPYESSRLGLDVNSPLHRFMLQLIAKDDPSVRNNNDRYPVRHNNVADETGGMKSISEIYHTHNIKDQDTLGNMTFLYTPGHSIDELCIDLSGFILTGDHILPHITPHPTVKKTYPEILYDQVATEYKNSAHHYGLACYMQSLGRVLRLDQRKTVLPAHRLFNHDRLNIRNLLRAKEIIVHHGRRLDRAIDVIRDGADTPLKIARELFPARKLVGGGLFAALSEVVSHLELLDDLGDIEVGDNGELAHSGGWRYRDFISEVLRT